MWGAFNALAEQAKKAAADLEGQINESVGVEVHNSSTVTEIKTVEVNDNNNNDDGDDDVWKDDDFDLDAAGLDTTSNSFSPAAASSSNGHNNNHAETDPSKPTITQENGDHPIDASATQTPSSAKEVHNDGWEPGDDDLELSDTDAAAGEEQFAETEERVPEKPSSVAEEFSVPKAVVNVSEGTEDRGAGGGDDGGDGWQDDSDIEDSEQPADENDHEIEKDDVLPTEEYKVEVSTSNEKEPEPPTMVEEIFVEEKFVQEEKDLEPAVPEEESQAPFGSANDMQSLEGDMTPEVLIDGSEKGQQQAENEIPAALDDTLESTVDAEPKVETSQTEKGSQVDTANQETAVVERKLDSFDGASSEEDEPSADTSPSQNETPAISGNDTNSFDTSDVSGPADSLKEKGSSEVLQGEDSSGAAAAETTVEGSQESPDTTTKVSPAVQDEHTTEIPKEPNTVSVEHETALEQYRQLVERLQTELQQRESQLVNKTEQMTSMQAMFEAEKQELAQTVENTKTEAKRRIQMAKERVEKAEARAAQLSRGQSEDAQKQAEIISELRTEGEKLAHKQAEMEKAVRLAKGETRKLRESLQVEEAAKDEALETIEELRGELKSTKEQLASARKGESQASKLETELQSAREDAERKASTILSLEQQVKELKAEAKDRMAELEAARKGAAVETEREQKKLRKEQSNLIDDFETKLRTAEKEAAVREDALRQEVSELRKRWQDAVRRADALSMDVQSSTAPLLRQLESMERQNRARAGAWTELENKLREELEETVIANEKLVKEKTEMKTTLNRLERSSKENEGELRTAQNELEEKTYKVKELEDKLAHLEEEGAKREKEYAEVERLANEGVARVRSEMSQTMLEADERHRAQVDSLQAELRVEREKRSQLEHQVQELVDKAGSIVPANTHAQTMHRANSAPTPKLRKSEGQAEILAGALDGYSDDEPDVDLGDEDDDDDDEAANNTGTSSFAALEELTSRLKSTKVELNTLRKSLAESEKSRSALMEELSEARHAREKLPLFEARVKELTVENEQMSREIEGLQADIVDVRELYRTQLNALLEEKASNLFTDTNRGTEVDELVGSGTPADSDDAPEPSESAASVPGEILEV